MAVKRVLVAFCLFAATFSLPQDHASITYNRRAVTNSTSQVSTFTFDQLYDMSTNFMEQYMYPQNVQQAKQINSTVFSEDVLGRVDATRNFAGRELNTEYIVALFANIALNPSSFTILGYPLNYTVIHFAANQNIVSFAVTVDFNVTATNTVVPQEIDVWLTFNSQRQISQYDITFRYIQWQISSLETSLEPVLGVNSTTAVEVLLQEKLAKSICGTAKKYCNGTNQQYDSTEACEDFLINDVRFGQAYEWGMDTVTCRMIHQNMVPVRPDVHCPHIGPTGGGYCNDGRTYAGNVLQPYFVNSPFVPYGKSNSAL